MSEKGGVGGWKDFSNGFLTPVATFELKSFHDEIAGYIENFPLWHLDAITNQYCQPEKNHKESPFI